MLGGGVGLDGVPGIFKMAFVTFPLLRAESVFEGEWEAVSTRQTGTSNYIGVDYSTFSPWPSYPTVLQSKSVEPFQFLCQGNCPGGEAATPFCTILPRRVCLIFVGFHLRVDQRLTRVHCTDSGKCSVHRIRQFLCFTKLSALSTVYFGQPSALATHERAYAVVYRCIRGRLSIQPTKTRIETCGTPMNTSVATIG